MEIPNNSQRQRTTSLSAVAGRGDIFASRSLSLSLDTMRSKSPDMQILPSAEIKYSLFSFLPGKHHLRRRDRPLQKGIHLGGDPYK